MRPENFPRCSFCKKSSDAVRQMAAGRTSFICNECVDQAVLQMALNAPPDQQAQVIRLPIETLRMIRFRETLHLAPLIAALQATNGDPIQVAKVIDQHITDALITATLVEENEAAARRLLNRR